MRTSSFQWSQAIVALSGMMLTVTSLFSQAGSISTANLIVQKINNLESTRDPKCYATASRLEDFMYGTPLDVEARNLRTEVQKEIAMFLRDHGSERARGMGQDSISGGVIRDLIDSTSVIATVKSGDIMFRIDSGFIQVKKIDYDQYSSVAYGYRALLSVEQDLFYIMDEDFLPLTDEAVSYINSYLNIVTLVSLQIADATARAENSSLITEPMLRAAWIRTFSDSGAVEFFDYQYPDLNNSIQKNEQVLRTIIRQKIASYEQYNHLSQSVFLRNIQVFFARQMWPVDSVTSNSLKNYYLESLIAFTQELIKSADIYRTNREDVLIRVRDVEPALQGFLPHTVNNFEDVIYFPNNEEEAITIEAYDLDAFRDGGLHWIILDYALEPPEISSKPIDPHAAELIVEGIAQMGVLVLRLAGEASHAENKEVLDIDDITSGFEKIQQLIKTYPEQEISTSPSFSQVTPKIEGKVFVDVTDETGLHFEHRSSDWLSRLIRSYVYAPEENTAKLSIPPAFGGAGVAAEDLNNDGYPDLVLLGGAGNKVYLNDGKGHYEDATDRFQINHWSEEKNSFGEPRQPIIVDFNNDGYQDLLVTYVDDFHRVYRNDKGEGFTDMTEIVELDGRGLVGGPATSFDYDNDGLLDVFIGYFGNYITGDLPTLSRNNQNGKPCKLYRNIGGFVFQEVLFTIDSLTDNGWTQAVGHTDINQDGRQDLIVGNDFGVNRYYVNDPEQGFIEMSNVWKTDKPSYTMNVGIGDINRDQHPDIYVSNIVVMQKEEKYVSPNEETTMKFNPEKMPNIRTVEANDLFVSEATGGVFKQYELSDQVGRGYSSTGWSWDADFFDYDNDGDEDLYVLNGMNDFRVYGTENPQYYDSEDESKSIEYAESSREKNVFFVNEQGVLVNRAEELGTDLLSNARSGSYLDFDTDGDLDILVGNYHDQVYFLENRSQEKGNWISIRLEGDAEHAVNRDAVGSSIIVDGMKQRGIWREVHSTSGYLSVHPKEQHVGVGNEEEVDVTIKWSNGTTKKIRGLKVNQRYHIRYPDVLIEK